MYIFLSSHVLYIYIQTHTVCQGCQGYGQGAGHSPTVYHIWPAGDKGRIYVFICILFLYIFLFFGTPSVGLLLLLVCYDSITVHPPFSIPFRNVFRKHACFIKINLLIKAATRGRPQHFCCPQRIWRPRRSPSSPMQAFNK